MPNRVYAGKTPSCIGNICNVSEIPEGGIVAYWPPDRRYPATVIHSCAAGFVVDLSNPDVLQVRCCRHKGWGVGCSYSCCSSGSSCSPSCSTGMVPAAAMPEDGLRLSHARRY